MVLRNDLVFGPIGSGDVSALGPDEGGGGSAGACGAFGIPLARQSSHSASDILEGSGADVLPSSHDPALLSIGYLPDRPSGLVDSVRFDGMFRGRKEPPMSKTYPLKDGTLTIHADGNCEFNNVHHIVINQYTNRVEILDKETGQELLCIVYTSRKSFIVC